MADALATKVMDGIPVPVVPMQGRVVCHHVSG